MQIQFLIDNEIKYSAKLNMTREQLFTDYYTDEAKNKKFKIPLNVTIYLNKIEKSNDEKIISAICRLFIFFILIK
jgi:hypothetical protein